MPNALRTFCLAAVLLIPYAVAAQATSHCVKGETDHFSCKVLGSSKVVSLCGNQYKQPGTQEINPEAWLQYRYGKLGAAELVYPKATQGSLSKFVGESRRGLGVSIDSVRFTNDGVTYAVENSYSSLTENGFSGVRVFRHNGTKTFSFRCEGLPFVGPDFAELADQLDPKPR